MGADGTRETVQRVAALEHRHQSSARMLTGDLAHHVREIGEILIGERELAERIASARVEAGRDPVPARVWTEAEFADFIGRTNLK